MLHWWSGHGRLAWLEGTSQLRSLGSLSLSLSFSLSPAYPPSILLKVSEPITRVFMPHSGATFKATGIMVNYFQCHNFKVCSQVSISFFHSFYSSLFFLFFITRAQFLELPKQSRKQDSIIFRLIRSRFLRKAWTICPAGRVLPFSVILSTSLVTTETISANCFRI